MNHRLRPSFNIHIFFEVTLRKLRVFIVKVLCPDCECFAFDAFTLHISLVHFFIFSLYTKL